MQVGADGGKGDGDGGAVDEVDAAGEDEEGDGDVAGAVIRGV
jgi:hypothetical protein